MDRTDHLFGVGAKILGEQISKGSVTDEMAERLASRSPKAAPRDIRQLLRLSYFSATADGRELSVQEVIECSVFRGMTAVVST